MKGVDKSQDFVGKGEEVKGLRRRPRLSGSRDPERLSEVASGSAGISSVIPESFYSQFMTKDQQEKFAQILRSPELLKLDTEIARLKVLASNLDTSDTEEKNVKLLVSVHDLVGRLVATRHKMLYGDRHMINVQSIHIIMAKIVQVIEKHVVSPTVKQAIAKDLAQMDIEGVKKDGVNT